MVLLLSVRCLMMAVVGYILAAIAVIEHQDRKAGGAIEAKMASEEANLKWRQTTWFHASLDWHSAKGLKYGVALTDDQESDHRDTLRNTPMSERDRTREVLASWGVPMHMAGFLGFGMTLVYCLDRWKYPRDRVFGLVVCFAILGCQVWAVYRQYFVSLGW